MENAPNSTAPLPGDLSFEDALRQLESIVRELESGQVPLDESIATFERGEALRAFCQKRLDEAKSRIEKIAATRDGVPTGTAPLDAG